MLKEWIKIEKSIFSNILMILNISKKEFVKEFAGTKLGILWALIRPLAMILVFWFVFQVGFKSQPTGDIPFILWLIAGYIPWLFIADNLTIGASSVRSNAYLVKKVKFPVEILPSIRILINFYTYFILMLISFMIFALYGLLGRIDILEITYYTLATLIFTTGAVRLFSAWAVMSIDVQHALSVIIQFLFWMTPIMWPVAEVAKKMIFNVSVITILKINPVFYLITGFRDGFLGYTVQHGAWIYHAYFWVFTIALLIISSNVFAKLRPEFDDVL